jgi:hypothetical protein
MAEVHWFVEDNEADPGAMHGLRRTRVGERNAWGNDDVRPKFLDGLAIISSV